MNRTLAISFLLLGTRILAQESALPPTLSTTGDLRVFQASVDTRRAELGGELASIQETLTETRTASIAGLTEALARRASSLDQLRQLLSQQATELQQSANVHPALQQVDAQLGSLRSSGPVEAPPYSPALLDQLRTERTAEEERGAILATRRQAAVQAAAESVAALEKARQILAGAEAALAANADPTRSPTLSAEIAAARAEVQHQEENWRLRDLELRNEELELELHRRRLVLLDEKIVWIRKDLRFRPEDLRALELQHEKEAFDLQRSLESARLELAAAERRWTVARQKLDGLGEPDELLGEEVQTHFQNVQTRQREIALMEKRLSRSQRAVDVWGARYRIASGSATSEEAVALATESRRVIEELSREEHLQSTRIADLEREVLALVAQVSGHPAGSRLHRTLRDRQVSVERLVKAGRANLASIRQLRGLRERLLEELPEDATRPASSSYIRRLGRFLRARKDRLVPWIWPVLRVLLILCLGFPLNLYLSRKVQELSTRLYNAQSGMIAGKVVYYGGVTLLIFLFLNSIGIGMAPLLGAAGVTGVALGFASQTSVSNMISGLFLIAEQPFQVDDIITVDTVTGQVLSIDLLSVKLRQFDNKFTRIPNETILKSNVTNISRHPIRRVEIVVAVAYKEDMAQVEDVLRQVAADDPDVLQNPEPAVIFQRFADSGIDYKLCAWVARENFLKLLNRIPRTIKQYFDREGIEIPFPHLSLYRGEASKPIEVRLSSGDRELLEAKDPDPGT